jgi:hypothetical protein
LTIRIGFICPTHRALDLHSYTETALRTFFETTPDGVAIVVDDGTPGWSKDYEERLALITRECRGSIRTFHFPRRHGLTRSWNWGLHKCRELGLDYAIAGNNDIIFTPKWYEGMLHALQHYVMVGPLSNAPGITAKGKQEIGEYYPDYKVTDNAKYLQLVAETIHQNNLGKVVESEVNGFFQMCSMSGWQSNMYSQKEFYRPVNNYTSKGRRNPTPLMTLNEDEWQGRATAKKLKMAIALSSFIFHYRAVTRGDRYKRGQWYRKT